MAIQRKMTIKERAQWLWAKHKGKVLILTTMLGIGIYLGVKHSRPTQRDMTEEEFVCEALKAINSKQEEETCNDYHLIQADAEHADILNEEVAEKLQNDPDRKLTEGGYIRDNSLYEPDCPNALCNEVPLTSLGSFGQDMINKLKKEFPDYEKIGPFDPETAVADIYIDFCHAKWLAEQEWLAKQAQEKKEEAA